MAIFIGDNKETIVGLGIGDVLVSTARFPDEVTDREVVFSASADGIHPVGAPHVFPEGASTANMVAPVVRLQFSSVASVDVVLAALNRVKTSMMIREEDKGPQ